MAGSMKTAAWLVGLVTALMVTSGCAEAEDPASASLPDEPPIEHPGAASGHKVIRYLMYRVQFGFDADTVRTSSAWYDGEQRPAAVRILLGTDGWALGSSDPDKSCQVLLDISGLEPSPTPPDGQWWAVEAEDLEGSHDCDDFDWYTRFGMDPVDWFGKEMRWTISLGPIRPVMEEPILEMEGTNDHTVGGRIAAELAAGGTYRSIDNIWAWGHPAGPDLVVPDPSELLLKEELSAEPLPTGYYSLTSSDHSYYP